MIKVSVIIPVYNTELYLKECLESVINQSLKEIEIICINDGSTDGSFKILKEYSKLDSRIILINQENRGLSEARNNGIKIAKGEYIHFLDSDDFYYKNDALEKLYKKISKNNVDILFFDIVNFYEKTKKIKNCQSNSLKEKTIYSGENILKNYLVKEKVSSSSCYKIFKKKLFNKMFYTPNIYFEDGELFLRIIPLANKIEIIRDIFLCIRERENSITTSFKEKYIDSLIEIFKTIDKIEDYNITLNDKNFYKLGLIAYVIKLYIKSRNKNIDIEKRINKLKKENIKINYSYFIRKEFNKKVKIERFILYINTFLYIKIIKFYLERK